LPPQSNLFIIKVLKQYKIKVIETNGNEITITKGHIPGGCLGLVVMTDLSNKPAFLRSLERRINSEKKREKRKEGYRKRIGGINKRGEGKRERGTRSQHH